MRTFKSGFVFCILLTIALGFGTAGKALGQDFATAAKTLVFMDRGIVWDSWTGDCHGLEANFAWYGKTTDYPGFEPGFIKANVGGFASHMYGSSWGYAALRAPGIWPGRDPHPDIDVQDAQPQQSQGLIVNTLFSDTSQQWVQTVSDFRWPNGDNYYLRKNPLEAEEVIDAVQDWNPNYKWNPNTANQDRHFSPIRKTYKVMVWTGQRQDQKYTIEELTIKNVSDDPAMSFGQNMTLYDFYVMKNYYADINARSWNLLGQGAVPKDNTYIWDDTRNAMFMWAGQWTSPLAAGSTVYNFVGALGPSKQGEWAASGHLGLGFLYSSPNKFGEETHTENWWNAICNNVGMGTDAPYQGVAPYIIVANGRRTAFFLSDVPRDPNYGNAIFNQHMTTGPWDLAPGQSIKVVQFQGVNGVDLEIAMNLSRMSVQAEIATGLDSVKMLWDKAKLTTMMAEKDGYAAGAQWKGWIHPNPPPCPFDFTIAAYRGDVAALGNVAGNQIGWTDWAESQVDIAYGVPTLDNYTVWRSDYFAFMGWYPLANIKKGDANYYNAATKSYKYIDTNVKVGFSYFYALSSSDAGHTTWPPRPQAIAEYPLVFKGGVVPPQQTSIQASLNYHFDNTKWVAFRTQRNPGTSLSQVRVFPNPFVARAGYTNPTDADGIHFANIPSNCEIRIYTLRGDLVATGPGSIQITQDAGSGEAVWKQLTSSEQFPKSGLYFYTITAKSGPDNGKSIKGKFVVIR